MNKSLPQVISAQNEVQDRLSAVPDRVRIVYTNTVAAGRLAERLKGEVMRLYSEQNTDACIRFDFHGAQNPMIGTMKASTILQEYATAKAVYDMLRTSEDFAEAEKICLPLLNEKERLEAQRLKELAELADTLHAKREALEKRRADLMAHPDLAKGEQEIADLTAECAKRQVPR